MDRISHLPTSPLFLVSFHGYLCIAALDPPATASRKTIGEMSASLDDVYWSAVCPYYTLTTHFTQSSHLFLPLRHKAQWEELQMWKPYQNSDHASSCSPQKAAGYSRVGLLAWRWQANLHAALPSPAIGQVVFQSSHPHLQWRNRAGFSPDFPVMPRWAPETDFV